MAETYTERFHEIHELAGATVDTFAAGVHEVMTYRSMANHQKAELVVVVGEIAQGAEFGIALGQATDAAGTDAKAITGKQILGSQALGSENSVYLVEVRTEELDVSNGFAYIGGHLVVTGDVEMAIIGFLSAANHPPVATTNWAEIVE